VSCRVACFLPSLICFEVDPARVGATLRLLLALGLSQGLRCRHRHDQGYLRPPHPLQPCLPRSEPLCCTSPSLLTCSSARVCPIGAPTLRRPGTPRASTCRVPAAGLGFPAASAGLWRLLASGVDTRRSLKVGVSGLSDPHSRQAPSYCKSRYAFAVCCCSVGGPDPNLLRPPSYFTLFPTSSDRRVHQYSLECARVKCALRGVLPESPAPPST